MEINAEQIVELKNKASLIDETMTKINELLADIDSCNGNTTKALIVAAVKKNFLNIGINI